MIRQLQLQKHQGLSGTLHPPTELHYPTSNATARRALCTDVVVHVEPWPLHLQHVHCAFISDMLRQRPFHCSERPFLLLYCWSSSERSVV